MQDTNTKLDLTSSEGVNSFFETLKRGYFSIPESSDLIRQLFNSTEASEIAFEQILFKLSSVDPGPHSNAFDEVKLRLSNKIDFDYLTMPFAKLISALDYAGLSENINVQLKIREFAKKFDPQSLVSEINAYAMGSLNGAVTSNMPDSVLIVNGYSQIFATMQKFDLLENNKAFMIEAIWKWNPDIFGDVRDDLPLALSMQFRKFENAVDESVMTLLANKVIAQGNPYQIATLLYNGVFDFHEAQRFSLYVSLLDVALLTPQASVERNYIDLIRDRFQGRSITLPIIDKFSNLDL